MYSQRQKELHNSALGFGDGSIWNYGCKLVSLSFGLKKFGIDLPPIQLNELLKKEGLFTGSTKNLINDALISKLSFIDSFQRINSFTTQQLSELLKDHVVIGEVSPIPIGGTGQHFVLVLAVEGANAIIGDPWWGDELKVAQRYADYGNIKSLRVYKIKPENEGTEEGTMLTYLGASTEQEAKTRLKEHLGERDGKCNWGAVRTNSKGELTGDSGGFLGSERVKTKKLEDQIKQLEGKLNDSALYAGKLETQIENLQAQKDTEIDRNKTLQLEISSLKTTITVLKDQIKQMEKDDGNQLTDEQISKLESYPLMVKKIEDLETKLKNLDVDTISTLSYRLLTKILERLGL